MHSRRSRAQRRAALAGIAISIAFSAGTALAQVSGKQSPGTQSPGTLSGPFELWDGVVVDPERALAYTMSPGRAVEAVALDDGKLAWTSKEAAKPLLAGNGRVVAQAEPAAANTLEIVTLDAGKGVKLAASSSALPAGVHAGIDQSPQGRFVATGSAVSAARRDEGGKGVVTWTYKPQAMRGIRDRRSDSSGAARSSDEKVTRGAVSVDLADGQVKSMPSGARSDEEARGSLSSVRNRLDDRDPYVEAVSADGRHVARARSRSKDGDSVFVWQITERASGKRVGEFEHDAAYEPFYVRGNVVYLRSTATMAPSGQATGPATGAAHTLLKAVDLGSGSTLWTRPVRDTTYGGPFPP